MSALLHVRLSWKCCAWPLVGYFWLNRFIALYGQVMVLLDMLFSYLYMQAWRCVLKLATLVRSHCSVVEAYDHIHDSSSHLQIIVQS